MTDDASLQVLATKCFTLADQQRFATLSGDFNPIHVDPVQARRSISGACIVHGVHGGLWALDRWAAETGATAIAFKARFLKPIFLDEPIEAVWNAKSRRLLLRSGATVLASVAPTAGKVETIADHSIATAPARAAPANPSFEDCARSGAMPFRLHGDPGLAMPLFGTLCAALGRSVVAEIAALSQIVGMEQPGLNSLFTALHVQLRAGAAPELPEPSYHVASADDRFKLLNIDVRGTTLTAAIEAFYRPAPTRAPSMAAFAARVGGQEFAGVHALVIGGSRGLGEWVAKAVAAGGGQVLITYNVGAAEAAQVVEEIKAWGGSAACAQWSAGQGAALPAGDAAFNQAYYFATPRIRVERAEDYAGDATDTAYDAIYVDGFEALCAAIRSRGAKCAVYYPSTVFIDSPSAEFQRYIDAKMRGEALCARLNAEGSLAVIAARLPRLPTDQTLGFTTETFDDPLTVLLPWLRAMPVFTGS